MQYLCHSLGMSRFDFALQGSKARSAGLDADIMLRAIAQFSFPNILLESICGKMFTLAASLFSTQWIACCQAPSRSGQEVIARPGSHISLSMATVE